MDTPGHADFGGEVERGLTMVDGVMLLVDASEGPLPQTRFVLRKALEAGLPVVLCVNKVDRPDARIAEVVDEVYALFIDLDASEEQIEFPIAYTNAKAGWASLEEGVEGTDLQPLLDLLVERIPAPEHDESHPLQARVTNLDADPYVGRLALCRVHHGRIAKGETVAWCRRDGSVERVRVTELYVTEGLARVPADSAAAGEIIALAGIPGITIGETIADPEDPRPLPVIAVEEPALGVTIGINSSPLAGRSGTKLTARQVRDRLEQELVGNVAVRVLDTERPDTWEVQGRGELQLAVLVEAMRREGFELTVGKPQVVTREVDGVDPRAGRAALDRRARGLPRRRHPDARSAQGADREHGQPRHRLGAARVPRADARADRLPHRVPDRDTRLRDPSLALRALRAVAGRDSRTRPTGSLVADRRGPSAAFALLKLQERGQLFVAPGEEVYEGMVVGENARADDLDVNAVREKKLTNMRAAGSTTTRQARPPPPALAATTQALESHPARTRAASSGHSAATARAQRTGGPSSRSTPVAVAEPNAARARAPARRRA